MSTRKSFLTAFVLAMVVRFNDPLIAQGSAAAELAISLTGDSNTEQAAKLELIRILQERLNKLTVAQLNARVIVSRGVLNYYKIDEIRTMNQTIYAHRSKYVALANKIETGNPGFSASQGNGLTYKYIVQLNEAVTKAKAINDQLSALLRSGQPIMLPSMPTFTVSAGSSSPNAATSQGITDLMAQYGVSSQEEIDALPADKKAELEAKMKELALQSIAAYTKMLRNDNNKLFAAAGNLLGASVGIPGAGNLIVGALGGNGNALSTLVGSIVDSFQIPTDYYDSNTLKLTDAERLKVIDELHLRISDLYQQVSALGASLSSETKSRYNEITVPRNEGILYGPKR